jgi:large conductance mechanosensitive channel
MDRLDVKPRLKKVRGFVGEFQEFITRGNVMDLAIGIIIGAAFTGIVNSLVNDIIMPPIGLVTGKVDFSGMFLPLDGKFYPTLAAANAVNAPVIRYGLFLNAVINFLIVGVVIFFIVKQINRLKRKQAAEDQAEVPEVRHCPYCMEQVHEQATRCPHCTAELKSEIRN